MSYVYSFVCAGSWLSIIGHNMLHGMNNIKTAIAFLAQTD
jgi:hypothetical protein